MPEETVATLIYEKFASFIVKDELFKGISDDLIKLVRERRLNKADIEGLLRKTP